MAVQFKATGVPLFKATNIVAMDPACCCSEAGCVDWSPCSRPTSYDISGATTTLTSGTRTCSSMTPNGSHSFAWIDCDHILQHGGCTYLPSSDFISCQATAVLYQLSGAYRIDVILQYISHLSSFGSFFQYRYGHAIGTCPTGTIALTYVTEGHTPGVFSVNPTAPSSVTITI